MKTTLNIGLGVLIALALVAGGGALAHQRGLLTLRWPATSAEHDAQADGEEHKDGKEEPDAHDAPDHAAPEEGDADHDEHKDGDEEPDAHEGHDHSAHAGEEAPRLTQAARERAGIVMAVAGPGSVGKILDLPGEVAVNGDRVVHIVPQAFGVVREVAKSVGDRVATGDILAWVESDELAEAKLTFYNALAEIGCCEIEVPRAKEIFENTSRLLTLLEKDPDQKALRSLDGKEMGEYRATLVTAYAKHVAAKMTYEREAALRDKNISSVQELVQAEATLKEAQAGFMGAKDTARYKVLVAYTEAVQKRQGAEFAAVAAEHRLRLKGADDDVVKALRALVPKTASLKPCVCDDPNCKDGEFPSVLDTLGKDKRFAWYPLRAPVAGVITEKHIAVGERLTEESEAFTITDLSSVWVNLSVYPRDLECVKEGHEVSIEGSGHCTPDVRAPIAYVGPTLGAETRTALARVIVPNPTGHWRPGLFVTAQLATDETRAAVAIPKNAVQTIDGESVVFVEHEGESEPEPVPVKLGRSNRTHVEITSGLKAGDHYVVKGAFDLKAKIVTSGLDPHAGHGH
ncbi:efflux RND transporter periplasmic adaptor subunit [bacterium]|nr:efflux RND transporter periplasmic adaptor subunit [bacterium]